jgi:hypothetical protein
MIAIRSRMERSISANSAGSAVEWIVRIPTTSARCMTGPPSAMAIHDGNDGVDMTKRWRARANRPSTGR